MKHPASFAYLLRGKCCLRAQLPSAPSVSRLSQVIENTRKQHCDSGRVKRLRFGAAIANKKGVIAAAPIQKLIAPSTEASTGNTVRDSREGNQSFSDVMASATTPPKPAAKENGEADDNTRRQSSKPDEKKQAMTSSAPSDPQLALLQTQAQLPVAWNASIPVSSPAATPQPASQGASAVFAIPDESIEPSQQNSIGWNASSQAMTEMPAQTPQTALSTTGQMPTATAFAVPQPAAAIPNPAEKQPENSGTVAIGQDKPAANPTSGVAVAADTDSADAPATTQVVTTQAPVVQSPNVARIEGNGTDTAKAAQAAGPNANTPAGIDGQTASQTAAVQSGSDATAQIPVNQAQNAAGTASVPTEIGNSASLLQMRNQLLPRSSGPLSKADAALSRSTDAAPGKKSAQVADASKSQAQRTDEHSAKNDSDASAQSNDQGQSNSAQGNSQAPQIKADAAAQASTVNDGSHVRIAHVDASSHAPAAAVDTRTATAQDAAPVSTAGPKYEQPLVNTARLIQTMNEIGLRVGMRTAEFGNISISTSSNRDAISAQISVDHGELAKAIAAHLPEVQARIGATQSIEVRVGMNGHTESAMGTMSQDSGQRGQGEWRQSGGSARTVVQGFEETRVPDTVVAAAEAVRSDSRLDIRV